MRDPKNSFICLLLIAVLFGCAGTSIQQKLLKSMEKLDRVYIPAFIFTNLQKQRESELAMESLKRKWNGFNRRYCNMEIKYGLDIVDKFWKEDFEKINKLITSAEALVRAKKLDEAHGKLQRMRLIFKELRQRNGIDYFLDKLTGFSLPLEEIFLNLRGKNKLGDSDLKQLRILFKEAQVNLVKAESAEMGCDFDQEKKQAVRERIKEEQRLLAAFAAALSSRNTDGIFQAAQDMKPNFIVLYKAFGDFQPIFDRTLKERKREEEK